MPELDVLPIAIATGVALVLSGVCHVALGGQLAADGQTAVSVEMRPRMAPRELLRAAAVTVLTSGRWG